MLHNRPGWFWPVLIALVAFCVYPMRSRAAVSDLERTAPELRDLWLRFHEMELCQGLDAVFVFLPKGVEIWCVIEEERSFERLQQMLDPLKSKFQVALYPTRPPLEKKSQDEREPPPSLWNNMELRSYLSDPYVRPPLEARDVGVRHAGESEMQLKQRISMYAEQVLEWDRKIKRYGAELPELTELAFDRSADPQIRARARSVILAHAQALDRLAGRLTDNLTQAMPRGKSKPKEAKEAGTQSARADPVDSAERLATSTESVSRRVFRFIHPRYHTVPIGDLKEPSLLESLRGIRKQGTDFQKILNESKP